jgi:branched-chain amino acid aminotransferase
MEGMAMPLRIHRTSTPRARIPDAQLGFGRVFTDHLLLMDYAPESGWHQARIEPYGAFSLEPSTIVFHYGQAVFDGLKAFRTPADEVVLFRPQRHLRRLNTSAARLCIPPLDEAFTLQTLQALVRLDADWVPHTPGCSLYLRPTIIATDPALGVHPSRTYRFFVIMSPVGAYYPEGFKPVKILVEDRHVRAVSGGLGAAKTPANYAASLLAAEEAQAQGFTQVLWLDGIAHRYIEEVGSMNIFFVIDAELVTPPLEGSILDGVTRDSVITLAQSWGLRVAERRIGIDDILAAHGAGNLTEVFGTGTAAVISPVCELFYKGHTIVINDRKVGPLTQKLYDALTRIQCGIAEDLHGWLVPVGQSEMCS